MAVFSYEELKQAARKARAEMAEKGRLSRKRIRRKPRAPEKRALLVQRAMDRLKRYPPLMTRQGLMLPYFKEQHLKREKRQ
jgi:transposase InsO family protein